MIQAERIAVIQELLNENGFVSVDDLVSRLNVSPMTVRRDLDVCHKAGLLVRCHGGASLKEKSITEIPYQDKSKLNIEEKERIAKAAASLVSENDSIYLDAGTTCLQIARNIIHISGIKVATNDLEIALYLTNNNVEVFVPGGVIQKSSKSILGESVTETVRDMSFSIAFIGTACINNEWEVMTPTMDKVYLKQIITNRSSSCYLVADSSKFHKQAMYKINSLNDYTSVITTYEFTTSEETIVNEEGIHIIKA